MDIMWKWTEFNNDEPKMTEMLRDPKNIMKSAGEHKRRDDKRFSGKEEIGTSAKKSCHVKNDVYYTKEAMTEASDIMKFDTRCAPERFGKVVSTFTEEQNEVLYLNSVVYGNIGGDVSKVLIVLWNKKEIRQFIKWLDKHGGFDSKEVKDNVSKSVPLLNSSMYSIRETDKISLLSKRKYSSRSRTSPFMDSKQSTKLHDDPPTEEKKRDLSKVEDNIPHIINLLGSPKNRIGRSSEVNFPPSTLYRAGPFVVTTPISDDDFCVLSYTLDDNLDKRERLVELEMNFICRVGMLSLNPMRWIHSEIITTITEMLKCEERCKLPNSKVN
ncbi:hypothetical protein AB3S75_000728 [Citrus x aurantiifolia]